MKTRPLLLFFSLLFLVACSSRGCATCVGYTPARSIDSLDRLHFNIEQASEAEGGAYREMEIAFSLEDKQKDGDSGMCSALPEGATLAWNGGPAQKPRKNGGGQNMWCGRGDAYTLCGQVDTTLVTKNQLLGGTPSGAANKDRLVVSDGKDSFEATIAAGRPKVESSSDKELTIVFEGFEGVIQSIDPCAFRVGPATQEACIPLTVLTKNQNRVTVKALEAKNKKPGAWRILGRVKLTPTTTCTSGGKPKTCSSMLSYPLNVTFTVL